MSPDIIQNENDPYILDYIEHNGKKYPALTPKNVKFIEAVIQLDSNYRYDLNPEGLPDKGFNDSLDPFGEADNKSKKNNAKKCGSTAYWFSKMKENKNDVDNFQKCLKWVIVAIDRANSTHLEASNSGRKTVYNRIIQKCPTYDKLISELQKSIEDDDHLIKTITEKIEAISEKVDYRFNISFATKFCAYASYFLNDEDKIIPEYSKYDTVVSSALPYYIDIYLGEKYSKSRFKVSTNKTDSPDDKLKNRMEVYREYSKNIKEILDIVNKQEITTNEFDHIVWYALK